MSTTPTPTAPARAGKEPTFLAYNRFSALVRTQCRLALAMLISQATITVTGSFVRVTGSGLGCNTWPNCHPGSLVPVAGAAPWIQQAIEFGNRTLTFVLVGIAIALFVTLQSSARRKEIRMLAVAQIVGIIVQAVIGGASVLLSLRWWAVALHFVPSIMLVFLAAVLYVRIQEPDTGRPTRTYPSPLKLLAIGSVAALALVIVTGTMTTGAGVHSGDTGIGMQGRLEIDIVRIANIHAHFMYLYLGLSIGLVAALIAVKARVRTITIGFWMVGMIVLQAAVGIIQYNFGIPSWTVPVHVGMSSVCTALTAVVYAHWERKQGAALVTGSVLGDERRNRAKSD